MSFGIAGYLLWHVIHGIRDGKIHHSDSVQVCSRDKKPVMFWFLVTLFTLFSLMMLWAGYRSL